MWTATSIYLVYSGLIILLWSFSLLALEVWHDLSVERAIRRIVTQLEALDLP